MAFRFPILTYLAVLLVCLQWDKNHYGCEAFSSSPVISRQRLSSVSVGAKSQNDVDAINPATETISRRSLFQSLAVVAFTTATSSIANPNAAWAADKPTITRPPLEQNLYQILRVREATQQEARLIKSGKFKDVQRANVKLAVKFMIENYKLGDAFVSASSYLDGNERRVAAVNVGQNAVQDLYTILEYFDASDVQNLKVGSSTLSSDKESIVLKGLDATRKSIDDFLAFFPATTVDAVRQKVKEENELNFKEFDRNLGDIVNPNP